METKKFNLEIECCNNGFLVKTKSKKFVYRNADELCKQMAKEIEKMSTGEKMIIEYSKDGKQD